MADIFSKKKRSQIMSRIRSKGTKPEERFLEILQFVYSRRRKISRHVASLPGCPDFYIPSLNRAFFVDGCFYHNCPQHGHIPKSNIEYWKNKINKNVKRDLKYQRVLRAQGINVTRIWEHEIIKKNNLFKLQKKLLTKLKKPQ
jgi:DNA mismatch endonuclease (patch repair protein)